MDEPTPETRGQILSPNQAEAIVGLGNIKVNYRNEYDGQNIPEMPLFNPRQAIQKGQLWGMLINDHPKTSEKTLQDIASFLQQPEVVAGIGDTHSRLIRGTEGSMSRIWLTSTMLYPLLDKLLTASSDTYPDVFSQWKKEWEGGADPEKFKMATSLLFKLLSKAPKDIQEYYIPLLRDVPVQPDEAEFLAGVYEKVYGDINDPEMIKEADRKNRGLVDKIAKGELQFTSKDLFHTTDLSTLPLIENNGILSTECTSLTMDGFRESTFGVSFHMFSKPPGNMATLGYQFQTEHDTVRVIKQKAHLAFLNPSAATQEDFILYPPDSFWMDKEQRSNKIAGRYIAGYDASSKEFPNKSIAYVLIGLPPKALSFVVIDEKLKEEYATVASSLPFYTPAYSYEGSLLYTPEDYDKGKSNNSNSQNQS